MYYQKKKNEKVIIEALENTGIGLWHFPGGYCHVTINNLASWTPIDAPSHMINSYQKPDSTGKKLLPCLCQTEDIKELDVQGVTINGIGITLSHVIILNSQYAGTLRIPRDAFMSMSEWMLIPNKWSRSHKDKHWSIACHEKQVTITYLDMSIKMQKKTMQIFAKWYLTPQDKKKWYILSVFRQFFCMCISCHLETRYIVDLM